jgi:hypothetical protein
MSNTRTPKVWPQPAPPPPEHTQRPLPRITVRQLNRRGACLSQITEFRMRFGAEAIVTVEICAALCSEFDFEWATDELLHEQHAGDVWHALTERLDLGPDHHPSNAKDLRRYERILAEEFAKKYISVYPNVP